MAGYHVRPADPDTIVQREREERAREEVRQNAAENARLTAEFNEQQRKLEKQQAVEREARRKEVEEEQREAEALADQIEREQRVGDRARAILRERGYEGDVEMVG